MAWATGAGTINFLLDRGRLERIPNNSLQGAVSALLERAAKRLSTAHAASDIGDFEGGFTNAYDVYRMTAEALLLVQGLRATGGLTPHMAVEDAVCAQFGSIIFGYQKPIFERFRQGRHAAQYFDPSAANTVETDVRWALETAKGVLDEARSLLDKSQIEPF